jgi:hypothetical protein
VATSGRRYKSYAGETGISYRYFFAGQRRVTRPEGQGLGSDFVFVATADQGSPFALRVFVSDRGLTSWSAAHGRSLGANEQYAAAKMCLFRAFDEHDRLSEQPLSLVVDEANIESLLEPLDLV